jgi:hypothetical protein
MSISATPGTISATAPSFGDGAITSMSADSLLAYCQSQLGGLDDEITNQMNDQKLKLREQQAMENVQKVVESFGTAGPQDGFQFDKCLKAVDDAVASLPAGDPAATQLQSFKANLMSDYGYQPAQQPGGLTDDEYATLQSDIKASAVTTPDIFGGQASLDQEVQRMTEIGQLAAKEPTLGNPPTQDNQKWKGTTDELSTDVSDIKSDAEIGLLQLQDLVSQRQQAVQLCTNMMSKVDDGLEDQAKAIGR